MSNQNTTTTLATRSLPTNQAQRPAATPRTAPTVDLQAEMLKELARLKAENEALKESAQKQANRPASFKVTEKGGVSVYGLGRFPVTLYQEQWAKLIGTGVDGDEGCIPDLRAFIMANRSKLTVKPADHVTATPAVRKSK